jgi:hypothetical protein
MSDARTIHVQLGICQTLVNKLASNHLFLQGIHLGSWPYCGQAELAGATWPPLRSPLGLS